MSKPEHDRTIDYVEFGATDIEATKRFYAACFGWKFTDYGPDYVAFEDGRLTGGVTTDSKPGGRRFHFLDPNGNELAVWGN
jgi:predicted enzyme related to lactoylglutathione lyase